jgi:hypothetical protein
VRTGVLHQVVVDCVGRAMLAKFFHHVHSAMLRVRPANSWQSTRACRSAGGQARAKGAEVAYLFLHQTG